MITAVEHASHEIMNAPVFEHSAIIRDLLANLKPEDCESQQEFEWALEFQALPLGLDLWSLVFLTPDGEVIWAGWEPLEIKRSRDEADLQAALAEGIRTISGYENLHLNQ